MFKSDRYEMIFLPSDVGMIKVYIYGFRHYGGQGRVFAALNDINVTIKGNNRNKAIVKALAKLHDSLLERTEED